MSEFRLVTGIARDPLGAIYRRCAAVAVGESITLMRVLYKTSGIRTYYAVVKCVNGTTVEVRPRNMQGGFHHALETAKDVQANLKSAYNRNDVMDSDNYDVWVMPGGGHNLIIFKRKVDL